MKRTLIILLALLWLWVLPVSAESPDPEEWIEGIWRWREENGGALPPEQAGATPFDWYAFDAALLSRGDTAPYRAALQKAAEQAERLATDCHRQGLALAALGGDPESLIARGITHREELGKQGASAYIWALILLDARQTPLSPDSLYTREELAAAVLTYQTEAGGFSLEGRIPDADITAMALCALYPYQHDKGCLEAVDRAWQWLSRTQLSTGGFQSWGSAYAESTAQVLIALCTWGRDPLTDPMFLKEGHTLLDALAAYRREDGGFAHTLEGDSNLMASEQVLRACIAWQRLKSGGPRLYDLSGGPAPTRAPTAASAPTSAPTSAPALPPIATSTAAPTSVSALSTAPSASQPTATPTSGTAAVSTAGPTGIPTSGPVQNPPDEGTPAWWLILPGVVIFGGACLLLRRRRP